MFYENVLEEARQKVLQAGHVCHESFVDQYRGFLVLAAVDGQIADGEFFVLQIKDWRSRGEGNDGLCSVCAHSDGTLSLIC